MQVWAAPSNAHMSLSLGDILRACEEGSVGTDEGRISRLRGGTVWSSSSISMTLEFDVGLFAFRLFGERPPSARDNADRPSWKKLFENPGLSNELRAGLELPRLSMGLYSYF